MPVIRCQSADVRAAFERWLTAESAGDIRLVILEGAMRSGKSSLTKEPISLEERQTTSIEVDHLRSGPRDEADNNQAYLDNVKRVPLAAAIQVGLATSPISSSWKGGGGLAARARHHWGGGGGGGGEIGFGSRPAPSTSSG